MCGLVGIAGKLATKDEATMKRLFLLDYFRGTDSTGLAAVRGTDHSIHVAKIASHPLDLFDSQRFKTALNGFNSQIFIGHNRAATKGLVNAVNAHPYHCGHIVGAHNGTLSGSSQFDLETMAGEKFGTDSNAIFAAIAAEGIEDVAPHLQGAWSLVWYDQDDDTLNFLRNKERPLWYAYSKEFDRLIWASEWEMIEAAVSMSTPGYELYSTNSPDYYRFFQTEKDTWYKFDMAKLKAGSTERPKPIVKKLEGKAPVAAASSGTYTPFPRPSGIGIDSGGKTTPMLTGPNSTTTSHGIETPVSNKMMRFKSAKEADKIETVVHLEGNNKEPLAGIVQQPEFLEYVKRGCSWCRDPIPFEAIGITLYEKDGIVLCPDCSPSAYDKQSHLPSAHTSRIVIPSLKAIM